MTAASEIPSTPPDWGQIHEDITCPLCGYNLRGLSEPRCPECGRAFVWIDLLDPALRRHPYLFEHHPERNVWSFVRTAIGGLNPWRFWRVLTPQMRMNTRRLMIYWIVCIVCASAAFIPGYVDRIRKDARQNARTRAFFENELNALQAQTPSRLPATDEYMRARIDHYPTWENLRLYTKPFRFRNLYDRGGILDDIVLCAFIWGTWPWLIAASLLLFPTTLRRAKVQRMHVLRASIYACDAASWLIVPTLALTVSIASRVTTPRGFTSDFRSPPIGLELLLGIVFCAIRFGVSCIRYLRVPHGIVTAILAHLIALLLLSFTFSLGVRPFEMVREQYTNILRWAGFQ